MDALDKFVFGPVCHPTFDFAVKLENYAGPKAGKLVRASSSAAVVRGCLIFFRTLVLYVLNFREF